MGCFVPFNNKNLDVSFFIFRPTLVLVDKLVDALKQFSLSTHSLGCLHTCLFKSIHGSMIIWYGAWVKQSTQNQQLLNAQLLSMLTSTSAMAVLIEYSFFDSYAGESKDGSSTAKLSLGDIVTIYSGSPSANELSDVSYAFMALFRSSFPKMEGVTAGVCLRSQTMPRVACLSVWKSLHFCYSWILKIDHRNRILSYLDRFTFDFKYDIFKIIYVTG